MKKVPKRMRRVQDAIENLYTRLKSDPEQGHWLDFARIMSKPGRGSIYLSPEDDLLYRGAVTDLVHMYGSDDVLSSKAAASALQDALFDAFGDPNDLRAEFTDRLEAALLALDTRLSRAPREYECYFQIGGAAKEGLPFTFGRLRFVHFNTSQLRKFHEATRRHEVDGKHREERLKYVGRLRESTLWDEVAAIVTVDAKDPTAARTIAEKEVRRSVDVLNFFVDLTPYQHGFLYLPGERHADSAVVPMLYDSRSWHVAYHRVGPLGKVRFAEIRQHPRLKGPLRRMHQLFRRAAPTQVETILATAVEWAGRATAELRPEQAFLAYAIALECAMLPPGFAGGVGYSLRTRTAHIATPVPENRRQVARTVARLYKIRSKIVHDGSYEVDTADLAEIRRLCKGSLLRLLAHRTVRNLETAAEFNRWFEDKILR